VPFPGQNVTNCGSQDNSWLTSNANYPGGGGGRGHRQWLSAGTWPASYSSDIRIGTSGYSELWIRYYVRFENGRFFDHGKDIYHDGSVYWNLSLYADSSPSMTRLVNCGTTTKTSAGISDFTGQNSWDGNWHYIETHWKKNGNGTSTLRWWFDGVFAEEVTWNCGGSTWGSWRMPAQSAEANPGPCTTLDIDDIAVATSAYTGFVQDSGGRNMIGPVGPPHPPTNLRIVP
jgi:hypothetical protein